MYVVRAGGVRDWEGEGRAQKIDERGNKSTEKGKTNELMLNFKTCGQTA